MLREVALSLALTVTTLFAQESGKDIDSIDIEPPLLVPNRDADRIEKPAPPVARDIDLARLEKEFERTLILRALAHTGGHRMEAAHWLGWGRNTLTRKIKELKLDADKR